MWEKGASWEDYLSVVPPLGRGKVRQPLNEQGLQGGHLGTLMWVHLEGLDAAWHLVLTVSSGLRLPSVSPMSAGQFRVRPRYGPVLAGLSEVRRQASVCA